MNSTFMDELSTVSREMSPEQIREAIQALTECRKDMAARDCDTKSAIISGSDTGGIRSAVFRYTSEDGSEGIIRTLDASLPDELTARKYRDLISCEYGWWLSNGKKFDWGSISFIRSHWVTGRVRPMLIIGQITGGLSEGQEFRIGKETFILLTRRRAISLHSLNGSCSSPVDYDEASTGCEGSLAVAAVDGWYARLVSNYGSHEDDGTETVHA